jgi:DNA primase
MVVTMTTTTESKSLVAVLTSLGVEVRSSDGREIQGRCPVHLKRTGKEDGSPSWSMNATTGLWICFSCNARGTLPMLVSELTGNSDALLEVHGMLIDAGLETAKAASNYDMTNLPEIALGMDDLLRFGHFKAVPKAYVKKRNLDPEVLERYSVRWDADNEAWVIPITSPLGELKGWQLKGAGWVKNYPQGVKKANTLFGFSQLHGNAAVLVESPLDVVRFAGVFDTPQCVASFGSYVSEYQIRLLSMSVDRLVLALDDDVAGWKSMREMFRTLPNFTRGVWFLNYDETDAKDIGEMSSNELERSLLCSTLLPPWCM